MKKYWQRYLDKLGETEQLCALATLNAELAEIRTDVTLNEASECRVRLARASGLINEARECIYESDVIKEISDA